MIFCFAPNPLGIGSLQAMVLDAPDSLHVVSLEKAKVSKKDRVVVGCSLLPCVSYLPDASLVPIHCFGPVCGVVDACEQFVKVLGVVRNKRWHRRALESNCFGFCPATCWRFFLVFDVLVGLFLGGSGCFIDCDHFFIPACG